MKKYVLAALALIVVTGAVGFYFVYREPDISKAKIGISFGVGAAARWPKEMAFMEERAKELGITTEARLNRTDTPKTQYEDCVEMIDSGINVLIITPRDMSKADEIVTYAKKKGVQVIAYARTINSDEVDLFIGYDIYKIGQSMGRQLTEKVYRGDYIILKGDRRDFNSSLLRHGGMEIIEPFVKAGDIRVIMDEYVAGWSTDVAKELVKKAIMANGNRVDAILAPNDKIAGACIEVLRMLEVPGDVIVTGMDAEVDALRRVAAGTQDSTVYMDLQNTAETAINEAYHMITKQQVNTNSTILNKYCTIDAYLINGQLVTKENLYRVIIEPGYFTKEDIYGQ